MSVESYGALLRLDERPLATRDGEFRLHRFRNLATGRVALVAVIGDVQTAEPLLARVHSSCVTSETYGACDCDCAEQLAIAVAEIGRCGRGVVFYLMQEGRGAGFAAKARDRMLVQASGHRLTTFEAYEQMGLGKDHRHYDEVEAACRLLGIRAPLRLLTNNPDKVAALEAEGIVIESVRRLEHQPTPFNVHYITAKQRSGHLLGEGASTPRAAELPEPVDAFEPYALSELPHVLHMAAYLLPVRFGDAEPCWFRLHAYLDAESGSAHVVLDHRCRREQAPLSSVQRGTIEDRFPLREPSAPRMRWQNAVARIAARGAGCVLFESVEAAQLAPDPTGLDLLALHAAAP
jgi:3,4-dihydroxy 2-butanone 4-phosphate synthase / GTP cyclohydrolase II